MATTGTACLQRRIRLGTYKTRHEVGWDGMEEVGVASGEASVREQRDD
jgi:hypothetical protein